MIGGVRKLQRKQIHVSLLLVMVFFYVIYHVMSGNRGVISMLKITSELEEKEKTLATLQKRQKFLEGRIKLLQPGHYDLDFIDELARSYFGMIGVSEKVAIHAGTPK